MTKESSKLINFESQRQHQIGRVVNRYERRALLLLQKAAAKFNMSVCPKVRISDALPINHSGLSNEYFDYALKAHLDFIITYDYKPVIAVEFDGPGHLNPRSFENDKKKNEICEYFRLPLLRVDTQYLRNIGDSTILEFITEELLKQIQIDFTSSMPMFRYKETDAAREVSEIFLPYDVKHFQLSPKSFLDAMFAAQLANTCDKRFTSMRTANMPNDLYLATRLAKTNDQFYTAAALAMLDEDTAILGVGSVFSSVNTRLDAPFLAVALAMIDTMDLIRMFDASRYAGIEMRHAMEYLSHFKDYAAEGSISRFLSVDPLCKQLTNDWLRQTD